MKAFRCRVCENDLYLENSLCISCGSALGFSRSERALVPVGDDGRYTDHTGATWFRCANRELAGCNWLAPAEGARCDACSLTRTRPSDDDAEGLGQLPAAEAAKRHLVIELDTLGLPVVGRDEDPVGGLCFDMLSSVDENVVIGHANGVITIDLAESDDARRERVRTELGEPYRTMLGHLRHEIGHYLQMVVVTPGPLQDRCRELFGDETADYQAEIDRHYSEGPPDGWEERFITTYATMHPFEDFAETFAHFLHIHDTVDTAAELGLVTVNPAGFGSFRDLVLGVWVPLSIALNQINRSMGKGDLYPFVIPDAVLDKLDFVASLAPAGPGGGEAT
ncbi:putative zinc-binding metallopeptidase [Nocardioides zeae]|uniref:Zinc-binding metallopeptidase n=1 Tax=Nocardioides imazamoxiresistens TaxID=3231893 RepID=A0ABU3PVM6_9ACTN|nr:putative zinc-binding metallopeptidase [Nocardioides zeae]MDT9593282.1 putative zinc-binding metallopeptidase [Nocardioides zeae]